MQFKYTLITFERRPDNAGHSYYAFRWIDHETGRDVCARVGANNIDIIRRLWNPSINDWDRSIQKFTIELPCRRFDYLTKDWAYVGSDAEEMIKYIREQMDD